MSFQVCSILVGSIPKSSQLQHLHISWPNLHFHLVNSPFSVGSLLFLGYKGELHTSTGDIPIFHGETRSFWVSLHIIAPAVGPPGSPMGKTPPGEKMDQKLTGKIMGKRAE
jgi:hypothetical protein